MLYQMEIKKNWFSVSIEEWVDLEKIKREELSFYEKYINILSILSSIDTDDEIWDDLDIDDLNVLIKDILFINLEPPINYSKDIDEFKLINLNKISIAEWIDLDSYITGDFLENFTKILSICYRKYKYDEWGNIIYEPYIFNIEERKLLFDDVCIVKVFGFINTLIDWRLLILDRYKSVLSTDEGDKLDESEKEGLSEADVIDIEKDLEKEKSKNRFAWNKFINDLCGEDLSKTESILSLNFIYILNTQVMMSIFNSDN